MHDVDVHDAGFRVEIVVERVAEHLAAVGAMANASRRDALAAEGWPRSAGVRLGPTIIARRVIERHGGALVVGRVPMGGARFSVRVPVVLSSS